MKPLEVIHNPVTLERFQHEVAYRDGRPSDQAVVRYDARVLRSPSALLVVAWLWPDQTFAQDTDPFELAAATTPEEWRTRLGVQVQHALDSAAQAATGHGESIFVDAILRYLMWQADLSEGDVVRLQGGKVDQLAVWVRICRWLHLQFDDRWYISDPARLARRIEHAEWASRRAEELKHVPTRRLRTLSLTPQVTDPVPHVAREVYYAPKGRYGSLYRALAADTRPSPTYGIDEINAILTSNDESPLPPSATTDTSWWAGRGTKTEGRPQVAAWWSAGYRIAEEFGSLAVRREQDDEIQILFDREPTKDECEELSAITSVRFEALPGREEWLENEERIDIGEYWMPDSVSVAVPDLSAPPLLSGYVERPLMAYQPPLDAIEWDPGHKPDAYSAQPRGELGEDAELVALVQLLDAAGEMDREQIVRGLSGADPEARKTYRSDPADSNLDRTREVKSLLTKARRRGLIINRGTNRKPRWVTVGSSADLILQIKQAIDELRSSADQPTIEVPRIGAGNTPPEGFLALTATRLGADAPPHSTDVELAKAIVELAGADWQEKTYVSEDGLLTSNGLQAVRDAIIGAS
jgi:hypothetical protein